MTTVVTIPLRTVSESNARGHWAGKARRAREARMTVGLVCAAQLGSQRQHLRFVACKTPLFAVLLERIAPRGLDDDNLRGCLKSARDGVADALGLRDDSDPRIRWVYAQTRGKPREYAVRVTVTA